MESEKFVRDLLSQANLEVNGPNPWDPQIKDPRTYDMMVAKGSVGVGEAYMYGLWECEDLVEFFARITSTDIYSKIPWNFSTAMLFLKASLQNRQSKAQTLGLGKFHYDIPEEVWAATLDSRMTGSCAYFRTGKESLDEAQENKIDMVLRKAGLSKGGTHLEIGVGWAAFSGYALEKYGVRSTGVTVSQGQADYIRARYGGAIDVRVHDYRDTVLAEPVDAVTSAEMFEHVGPDNYRNFFEVAHRSLKLDGRMVLHTIVGRKPSRSIDPWMDKYIYPGGCLPTLGQIGTAIHGLFQVEDVHDIGAHYDPTLREWMKKFGQHREEIKRLGSAKLCNLDPEVFCRMWEYHYLASAGGFRSRYISVHQYVLSPHGIAGGMPVIR